MNPNLAPLLRPDLNPAYLAEENGILRYLNPADLAGDNGKYNKLYDRLAPLYDLGEWLARFKYGNGIAKMRREMMRLSVCIVSQNKKDTRQRAADSTSSTARRDNAVYFLFGLTITKN